MAGSLVVSVDICVRQNISWSKDNKIAVNVDKDLYILKLDCSPQHTTGGFSMRVAQTFSTSHLKEKHIPWRNLDDIFRNADKMPAYFLGFCIDEYSELDVDGVESTAWTVRNGFLSGWTFSKLGSSSEFSRSWGPCAWSPDGVGPNHRSVLAALTLDHQIHLFGQRGSLTQMADLSNQLSSSVASEFNDVFNTISSPSTCLLKIQEQMASISAVELTWSSIFQGDDDVESRFILLFVGMKNGDIVIWKLHLPVLGLNGLCAIQVQKCSFAIWLYDKRVQFDSNDCTLLSRHSLHTHSSVAALAWTEVPHRRNFGILGVGYEDGCVYLLPLQWEADSLKSPTFVTGSTAVESEADNMSVNCMTWMKCGETGPVLLYSKEQMLNAHCLSFPDNIPDVLLTKSSCASLGNSYSVTCLECVNATAIMGTQNGSVHLVKVKDSESGLQLESERFLPFQHKEPGWLCQSVAFSPNAVLAIALFSPSFTYDPAAQRFKDPTKIHMCCIPSLEMSSVESVVTSPADESRCYTDVLEFSRHVLCGKPINLELVGDMTQKLTSTPFTDTVLGLMVSRHLLTTLQHSCQNRLMDMEILETVTVAHQSTTESILCRHILKAWLNLSNKKKEDILHEDMLVVSAMFRWVQGSADRMERVGLEVIDGLNSVISQCQLSQTAGCVICDSEQIYSGTLSVQCSNEHTFGICTKTLAVCQDGVYQYCSVCGALALSPKRLEGLDWLPGDPSLCTLCATSLTISSAEYIL